MVGKLLLIPSLHTMIVKVLFNLIPSQCITRHAGKQIFQINYYFHHRLTIAIRIFPSNLNPSKLMFVLICPFTKLSWLDTIYFNKFVLKILSVASLQILLVSDTNTEPPRLAVRL